MGSAVAAGDERASDGLVGVVVVPDDGHGKDELPQPPGRNTRLPALIIPLFVRA